MTITLSRSGFYEGLPFIRPRLAANGSTDDTAAIHAAADSLYDAGGGFVVLPPGSIAVTGVELPARVGLVGAGMRATKLWLANSSNTHVVKNHVSTDAGVTDGNAQWVSVRDLEVDGNKANQGAGSWHGVKLSLDPTFPASKPAADDYYDSHQHLENVRVIQCKGSGVYSEGRSENRLKNVVTYLTDEHGIQFGSDTWIEGCTASWAGLAGFKPHSGSSSFEMATSKAFYCGQVTAASGHGFHFANNFGSHITGCIAQDNKANGFLLDSGCQGMSLLGVIADSNSTRGVSNNPGFDVWDSSDCVIIGRAVERKADGTNSYQRSAVRVRSNSQRNVIIVSHHAENSATLGQAVADVIDDPTNRIEINGSVCEQYLAATYAASYTPDPYTGSVVAMTLTGNVTINAPTTTNVPYGTRLRFVFTQDGTGGRTVTWNAVFKVNWTPTTTAAKVNSIDFMHDGTNWIQVGSAVNL